MTSGGDAVDCQCHHAFQILFWFTNQHYILGDDGLAGNQPHRGIDVDPVAKLAGLMRGPNSCFEHFQNFMDGLVHCCRAFFAKCLAKLNALHQQASCRHGRILMALVKIVDLLVEPCVEVGANIACHRQQFRMKRALADIILDHRADQPVLIAEIAVKGRFRNAERTRHLVE